MSDITICVITYNRPKSLIRLLNSLENAYYNCNVRLYISIDRSIKENKLNKECFSVASNFNWSHGEKIVDYKKENFGLKKNILSCGDLTEKYNNVIILEDDIFVSPSFFLYAENVLSFYKDDNSIGGFSLYSFPKQFGNRLPFYPINNGYDTYFIQCACSWGQMWTKKQWYDFKQWYNLNDKSDLKNDFFPEYISNWDKSWLKFYMKYLVDTNKFFVFPYLSYTTNFGDAGSHIKNNDLAFQSILNYKQDNFSFCNLENSRAVYDIYLENMIINKLINIDELIDCDFYQLKNNYKSKYVLTPKKLDYNIISSYSLSMYPYEENVINNIDGDDLFLYDTDLTIVNKRKKSNYNYYNYIFRFGEMEKNIFINLYKYLSRYGTLKIKNKLFKKRGVKYGKN